MSDARWQRIKSAFEAVMAVPADERAGAMDRECGTDLELRREVESLLSVRTQAFVRTGGAAAAMGSTTTDSAPVVEQPGEVIGKYKLLQVIGEGGFGTVFLAEQSEPVRRKVALKIIKLGMDTRQVIARFDAERQALALMDHPNIARVLDGGATPLTEKGGGRPYFVMEYVKGDAVTVFADAHRLGVRERLELFGQICSAVQHAHTKGVIHRDLKPGNVLVSTVDGKPFAKVIDFGIAKATGASLTDKTLFTEHRQLIGTPEYMSPEQAEGSPDIDTRTDVYALGVLLYELLTGRTPFDAKRLRSAAFAEMQRIIREEEPLPPSVRVSRDLGVLAATASVRRAEPSKFSAEIRGDLDWIVMKALDKDRARRYESASQMSEDIARHIAGEPVVAAPASAAYRVRKFVRRNKGIVGMASAVTAALAVGLVGTTWQWSRAKTANATLRLQNDGVIDSLTQLVSTLSIAEPAKNRGLYILADGRRFTVVRPKSGDSAAGVRILEGHVRDPEGALDRPQPPIDPEFAMRALAILIEDTAMKMQDQTWAAEAANVQLRGLIDRAKSGLISMMNEMSSEDGFMINPPRGVPGGNWIEKIEKTPEHERQIRVGNRAGAVVTMQTGRDAEGRSVLTGISAEGPDAEDFLLSMLVHNGLAGIRMNRANEAELEATNAKLTEQIEIVQRQAYRANVSAALAAWNAGEAAACRAMLDECPERLRDWEWRLIDVRLDDAISVSECDRSCDALQFSPDGGSVIWKGSQGVAGVCDPFSGREVVRIRPEGALVWAQSSPDGALVESLGLMADLAEAQGNVKPSARGSALLQFWDPKDGREVRRVAFPSMGVTGAVLSPDRRVALVLSDVEAPRLVALDGSGEERSLPDCGRAGYRQGRFSPDGRFVMTIDFAGPTCIFDVRRAELVGKIEAVNAGHAEFSPDSRLVVSVGSGGACDVWDSQTGEVRPGVRPSGGGRTDGFFSTRVAISPDGKLAATTYSLDSSVVLWDIATGSERARLRHADLVNFVAFSPDGTLLVTSTSRNTTSVWGVSDARLRVEMHGEALHSTWQRPAELRPISRDGKMLVTRSIDGRARVWDLTRVPGRTVLPKGERVLATTTGKPDALVCTLAEDGVLRVVDAATGVERGAVRPDAGDEQVSAAAFSGSGRLLAAVSGTAVRVIDVVSWRVIDRRRLAVDAGHAGLLYPRWAPSNDRVVVVRGVYLGDGAEGQPGGVHKYDVLSWDVQLGSAVNVVELPGSAQRALVISPDLSRAIVASNPVGLALIDMATGRVLRDLDPTRGWYSTVMPVFSPDGRFAAGVMDGPTGVSLVRWSATDGSVVWTRELKDLGGGVTALKFRSDGQRLAGVTFGNEARGGDLFLVHVDDGRFEWKAVNPGVSMDAIEFAADGKRLLTCRSGDPAMIDVWDAADGKRFMTLPHWLPHGTRDDGVRPNFIASGDLLLVHESDESFSVLSSVRRRDRGQK